VRVITYNILDGGEDRIPVIAQILHNQHPDMIALQEANDRSNAEQLARALKMHLVFGEANSDYHVAWLSSLPVLQVRNYRLPVLHKTLLAIDVAWKGTTLHLCTTHLRAGYEDVYEEGREDEIKAILETIEPMLKEPLLLVGDLNAIAPGDPVALVPEGHREHDERLLIKQAKRLVIARIREAGLVDCYRALHPTEEGYTCDARWDDPCMRIDYCFASPSLAQDVRTCDVLSNELTSRASDHLPVQVDFA